MLTARRRPHGRWPVIDLTHKCRACVATLAGANHGGKFAPARHSDHSGVSVVRVFGTTGWVN